MLKLNQDFVRHLFWYTPSTGEFYWKNPRKKTNVGRLAGHKDKVGYVNISIKCKSFFAHRLAWLFVNGYFPEQEIDHVNRDKGDNRICNLREASPQCNSRNTGTLSTNRSGVVGVHWRKSRNCWRSTIDINRKKVDLCSSKDFTEAVAHRLAAEQCVNWESCDKNSSALEYMKEYLQC